MMKPVIALALLMMVVLAGCAPAAETTLPGFETLPVGNPVHGEELYNTSIGGQPACKTCHTLDGKPNAGPTFQGLGQIAATRVSGQSAEEYLYESLIRPWGFIVPGYGNLMSVRYSQALSAQDTADLIAFMLAN